MGLNKNKKQRRPCRKFTDEFRADVVRLCQADGESVCEVARRLDLSDSAKTRERVLGRGEGFVEEIVE